MRHLWIKDIPKDIYERLKRRAEEDRCSLDQAALQILQEVLPSEKQKPTLEEIDRIRVKPKKALSADAIRAAIRTGRPH